MSDYMHLLGAEEVRTAANTMSAAAERMASAASAFDASVDRLIRYLDDFDMRWTEKLAALEIALQRRGGR